MNAPSRTAWQIGVGLLLIGIGAALLLNIFGVVEFVSFWKLWPLLLIIMGVHHITDHEGPHEVRRGLFWIAIGFWLLAVELHVFGFSYHNSWPVLLIIFGLNMILRPASRRTHITVVTEEHHAS
jgi:hypothetical protein